MTKGHPRPHHVEGAQTFYPPAFYPPLVHPKPTHLTWTSVGLVATGGTVGTALRYLVSLTVPMGAGVPLGTLGVNIVGAFFLGMLLEFLTRPEMDSNRGRRLRLLIGTGGLGGFTTYSALALDTATLLGAHPGRAIGYAVATVALGGAATMTGIWWSRRRADGAPSGTVQP